MQNSIYTIGLCVFSHQGQSALQVRTVNGIGGDEEGGNYTAVMLVTDVGAEPGVVSKVEFLVNLVVNKQVGPTPVPWS